MAKLKEILEIESQRESRDAKTVIHLFQEGSFYRAYERSAWLFVKFLAGFKVSRKSLKEGTESFVFIGFPTTSLQSRVPQEAEVVNVEEKHLQIVLPQLSGQDDDVLVSWEEEYQQWKDSIPIVENKTNTRVNELHTLAEEKPLSLSSIAQQIMSFSVESKTPIECMLFLAEMRKKVAQIF